MMSPYRNSSSSGLFPFVSLSVEPPSLHRSLQKFMTQDGFLTRMGRGPFPLFLSTNKTLPAFLEPKCLILSWLVVPDEKGVAFYCSIQKESLLLGSVMRMVQMLFRCAQACHTLYAQVVSK